MDLESGEKIEHLAREVVRILCENGHTAYFVGGCVRDKLLGLPIADVDIATDARPEQVVELFPKTRLVGAAFGVVLVNLDGTDFEVATFRKDGAYLDHRRPDSIEYGTIEEDARRRDFTVNALYLDSQNDRILDFVSGERDLHARRLRAIGNPRERFGEDALRLLRAVRFATRLDFEIESETLAALRELAPTIAHVSAERIRDELTAMLIGPAPGAAFRLLDATGLLGIVLPEIAAMKGVEQGRDYHPEGDVFEHTMLVINAVEPKTTINCLAALLHDVGKPATFERNEQGKISFYRHQHVGAEMAEKIMARLKFPSETIDVVSAVVSRHMKFAAVKEMKRSTFRRFVGAPTIEFDLAVHRADCMGSWGQLEYYDYTRARMREMEEAREPAMPPPFVTGNDLIAVGHKPGPAFKSILDEALDKQLEGELADRESALAWLREAFPP